MSQPDIRIEQGVDGRGIVSDRLGPFAVFDSPDIAKWAVDTAEIATRDALVRAMWRAAADRSTKQ